MSDEQFSESCAFERVNVSGSKIKRRQLKRQMSLNKSVRRSSLSNTFVAALQENDTDNDLINDEDLTEQGPEEILEMIQQQKEIIANVRSRPWPMSKKLRVLNAARKFVEKHEGRLSKTNSYSEAGKEIWRKLVGLSNNMCVLFTPWNQRIKTIESYFGSSVASYFIFLRWLVQINVIMGTITIAFLVVPEILVGNPKEQYKEVPMHERASAWDLGTIWSLGGYIKRSVLFYGFYTNDRVIGNGYRLPLAYFLSGISLFAYSFAALLRKMAKNSRLTRSASSEDDFAFSWRLFSSWDYMIGNPETAENKAAAIATAMREAIVEEQEKEKQQNSQKALRIFLRIVANILVLLLLAGSLYSIQFAVDRAQKLELVERETNFWEQNEVSIIVTLVTMITPSLFEVIGSMENYHPRNTLRLQLGRILMLYLANLYSLMIGLLGAVAEATAQQDDVGNFSQFKAIDPETWNKTNRFSVPDFVVRNRSQYPIARKTECWETQVGQELMKLSVIDFISTVLTILIVDFIRALVVRYMNSCCCWDLEKNFPEYGEFKIAENVLHLIYNQGITWVGSFFCPLLPMLNVVKLIIMMYIRSWAVTTCNVPHQRVFRASRSNNFYLAMLLFMLFLSLLPTVWVIVRHSPSGCGPFSNRQWMYTIVSETLDNDVPSWVQRAVSYITTPVVILPAILLLVMIIYYLQAIARSTKDANSRLKLQLHYERKEGKKSMFKYGAAGKLPKFQEEKFTKAPCLSTDSSNALTPILEAATTPVFDRDLLQEQSPKRENKAKALTKSTNFHGRRSSLQANRRLHADRNRDTRRSLAVATERRNSHLEDFEIPTTQNNFIGENGEDNNLDYRTPIRSSKVGHQQKRISKEGDKVQREINFCDVEDKVDITTGNDSTYWPMPAPRRSKQCANTVNKDFANNGHFGDINIQYGHSPAGNFPSRQQRYASDEDNTESTAPRPSRLGCHKVYGAAHRNSRGEDGYIYLNTGEHKDDRRLRKVVPTSFAEDSSGPSTPTLVRITQKEEEAHLTGSKQYLHTTDGYMIVDRNTETDQNEVFIGAEEFRDQPVGSQPTVLRSPFTKQRHPFYNTSSCETQDPSDGESMTSRTYAPTTGLRKYRTMNSALEVAQEGDFVYVIEPRHKYVRMSSPLRTSNRHVRHLVATPRKDRYVLVSETPSGSSSRRSSFNDAGKRGPPSKVGLGREMGSPFSLHRFFDENQAQMLHAMPKDLIEEDEHDINGQMQEI